MKRCFVAMAIAEETRVALAELRESLDALPRSAARRLRPVKPDNLHVTIKFLGDTPDAQIDDVVAALTTVAEGRPRPGARVEGVGAFPSPIRPRVLFAGLGAGRDAVTEISVAVARALVELGFEPERRTPHPHVTLARVEAAEPRGPITRWIEETDVCTYGPVADAELVLFESQLTPQGAIYERLAAVPLGAA